MVPDAHRNKGFRLTVKQGKGGSTGVRDPLSTEWKPKEGDMLTG